MTFEEALAQVKEGFENEGTLVFVDTEHAAAVEVIRENDPDIALTIDIFMGAQTKLYQYFDPD